LRVSVVRLVGSLMILTGLVGCQSFRDFFDPSNVDYRSAKRGPGLDVPPDLVGPKADDRYVVPERGTGKTFSDYSRGRQEQGREQPAADTRTQATASSVLPVREGARMERDGASRWLVVDQPPETVWPQLEEFWQAQGIELRTQSAELGTMDTVFTPRNERPERSGLRGLFSRAIGSSYTTSLSDAYRTRIERAPNGGTEIYVAHRALEEVVNSPRGDSSVWQPGPNRPELEVEMLRRMMLRLGRAPDQVAQGGAAGTSGAAAATAGGTASAAPAGAAAGAGPARPERAKVFVDQGTLNGLRVEEGFDRAWREVGLAIDRIGFTVEDRDRSKGTYYVRYVDLDRRDPRQGALSRLFSGERKDLTGQRYQIRVEGDGGASAASRVAVRSDTGQTPTTDADVRVANRIVALLHERIR
jgi:outer membrane protein assembly factor BamC